MPRAESAVNTSRVADRLPNLGWTAPYLRHTAAALLSAVSIGGLLPVAGIEIETAVYWRFGIAASLGILVYILIAMLAFVAPITVREQIGKFYLKLGARCLKQFTFVRRVLSGYDVHVIEVDEEQKLLTVTLSSPLLGDDNEYRYQDPDNRVMRLFNKPVSINFELVPAAVDAELAEAGHHVREKKTDEGLWEGDHEENPDDVVVDPCVEMTDEVRLIDPMDVFNLVANDVDPEDIKTAEKKTLKRFEKYGASFDPVQFVSGAMGFAIGIGGVMALQYFQQEIIKGGSSGDVSSPEIPIQMGQLALETVVTVL